ncbi:hypothetical protein GIY62_34745 (plasmid) [Burkholderia plantarii]|uniref:hypothetical protein n=1 Tax=Burkholderia plantarii TaxID=41899 RepID=UPI00272CA446|nr:hypothetical protein [Burkholderia plantarii]WLE64187.1 hypothetical protein GIY62_34745 [Burkholderia plantarii]
MATRIGLLADSQSSEQAMRVRALRFAQYKHREEHVNGLMAGPNPISFAHSEEDSGCSVDQRGIAGLTNAPRPIKIAS